MTNGSEHIQENTDYKAKVLRVLLRHSPAATTGDATACRCDRTWRASDQYQAHIADALMADAVEALEKRAVHAELEWSQEAANANALRAGNEKLRAVWAQGSDADGYLPPKTVPLAAFESIAKERDAQRAEKSNITANLARALDIAQEANDDRRTILAERDALRARLQQCERFFLEADSEMARTGHIRSYWLDYQASIEVQGDGE